MANEKQFQEAIARINILINDYGLNPNVAKYFADGKLYYSYLTAGGLMGSIDVITYDPSYAEAAKKCERMLGGALVYHAIESKTSFGTMLALLFVSSDARDWTQERVDDGVVMAYVVNVDEPDQSEIGYIGISGFGESGALVRTW